MLKRIGYLGHKRLSNMRLIYKIGNREINIERLDNYLNHVCKHFMQSENT